MHYIVGLGNPGTEYENTRHNVGRMAVQLLAKEYADGGIDGFKADKVLKSLKTKADIDGESAMLILPETFMNKSGQAVAPLIASDGKVEKPVGDAAKKALAKKTKKIIVIHDDLDLPFGHIKIVFNRGAGGNNGVDSIIRAIKTEAFTRIKIGISPTTPTGKLRKPVGEDKVVKFILGQFQTSEMTELKKVLKRIPEIVSVIVNEGEQAAMNRFNAR